MKIKELLKSEEKWTKDEAARDKDGDRVSESSDRAVSFCLVGAFWKCYPDGDDETRRKLANVILEKHPDRALPHLMPSNVIIDFNDNQNTTFEDVRAVLEAADV
jgi:hypothetical protein